MAIVGKKKAETPTAVPVDQPKPQPYRHTPKHAASDAAGQGATGTSEDDHQAILRASEYRMSGVSSDVSLKHAGVVRSINHNAAMYTPFVSGASVPPPRPQARTTLSARSVPVIFFTDPDAPPMPPLHRNHSSPVLKSTDLAESRTPASNPPHEKFAPNDSLSPGNCSDSGYGSAGPSSAQLTPSGSEEKLRSSEEYFRLRIDSGAGLAVASPKLAAEQTLASDMSSEEETQQPCFNSRVEEGNVRAKRIQYQDHARHNLGSRTVDEPRITSGRHGQEFSSPRSSTRHRSLERERTSSSKRSDQFERARRPSSKAARVLGEDIPLEILPNPPPRRVGEEPRVSFNQVAEVASSLTSHNNAPFDFELSSLAPTIEEDLEDIATTSAQAVSENARNNMTSQPSSSHAPSNDLVLSDAAPSLAGLEGFKVNKQGRVLDEEGQLIGELSSGDLLDCVRQKVTASGEVLDDFGRVVGRVRAVSGSSGPSSSGSQHEVIPLTVFRPAYLPILTRPRPKMTPLNVIINREPLITESFMKQPSESPAEIERKTSCSTKTRQAPALKRQNSTSSPSIYSQTPHSWAAELEATQTPANVKQTNGLQSGLAPVAGRKAVLPSLDTKFTHSSIAGTIVGDSDSSSSVSSSKTDTTSEMNPFAYKGAIPVTDEPAPLLRAQAQGFHSRTISIPNMPRTNSSSAGSYCPAAQPHDHLTRNYSNPKMSLATRHSIHQPARQSPLVYHESSPRDSEIDSLSESKSSDTASRHSYNPSSTAAPWQSPSVPSHRPQRTYFTHEGRKQSVESDIKSPLVSVTSVPSKPSSGALQSIPAAGKGGKKKRFSLGLSRKGSSAVAT